MAERKIFPASMIGRIADEVLGDPEKVFKEADKTWQSELKKLNDFIKVTHPWGKNRTFNLRQKHTYKNKGMLKSEIRSGADYSGALYNDRKKYTIVPRRKKMLSWIGVNGQRVFSKGVEIPARKGIPWIQNAFDEKSNRILDKVSDTLVKELLK